MTLSPTSLHLTAPGLSLEILRRGASIRRLDLTGSDGTTTNVVLGLSDSSDYGQAPGYHGATIGRFANRIARGTFTIEGRPHHLSTNEGDNTLHGGRRGFDQQDWSVVEHSPGQLTLRLVSPDGDQGFPGELTAYTTYDVAPGEVRITHTATTTAATPVSLTNHSYVNLDGEGADSIDDHLLTVHADAYTPTGPDLVPTGELRDVAGTPFDLREPRRIGDVVRVPHPDVLLGKGLDHNFVVDGEGLRIHAELVGRHRRLLLLSDHPALQVYAGGQLDGTLLGTSGRLYRQGAGIALEPQRFPDAPNQHAFPSATLQPGEEYRSTIIWRFIDRDDA